MSTLHHVLTSLLLPFVDFKTNNWFCCNACIVETLTDVQMSGCCGETARRLLLTSQFVDDAHYSVCLFVCNNSNNNNNNNLRLIRLRQSAQPYIDYTT